MGTFEDVLEQSSRKPGGPAPFLAKRKQSHQSTRRASCMGSSGTLWDLELHPISDLEKINDEIDALADTAFDRNIAFEPTAIEAFWPRMWYKQKIREPLLLCLYQHTEGNRALRFFMPVGVTKIGFPSRTVLQVLATDYLPDGTPLLDKTAPDETCQMLFQALCDPALLVPAVVDFKFLRADCETALHLFNAAKDMELDARTNRHHHRACLSRAPCEVTKKRSKEHARQMRRLGDLGELTFHSTKAPSKMIDAFEDHLALELKGWKGRRGTALYNHRTSVGFSRRLVTELAAEGACEIVSLNLDNAPIASLVLLGSDPHMLTWKIAYDEKLAAFSPGVQLMLHVTGQLQELKDFEFADSLAIPHHPMINHLWHERMAVTDWTLALNVSAQRDLAKTVSAKRRSDKLSKPLRHLRRLLVKRY